MIRSSEGGLAALFGALALMLWSGLASATGEAPTPNGVEAIEARLGPPVSGAPPRVLFVGNSFTYQHDIPRRVAAILTARGQEIRPAMIAIGGHQLHLHAIDPATRRMVADGGWAVLVLQDFSTEPLTAEGRLRSTTAAHRLAALGMAVPVFFATWPRAPGHGLYDRPWNPADPTAMNDMVEAHYAALAGRLGGVLAPVGAGFTGQAGLYRSDGYHAAPAGADLAARILAEAVSAALTRTGAGAVRRLEISAPDDTRPAKAPME